MKGEVRTSKWKLEASKRVGRVVLKRFTAERERVGKNRDGEIESELPFVETIYLLEIGKKMKLWLNEREHEDLIFLVDKEWD